MRRPSLRSLAGGAAGIVAGVNEKVGGGHIIDPAAPEVIGFVRQIVTDSLAA